MSRAQFGWARQSFVKIIPVNWNSRELIRAFILLILKGSILPHFSYWVFNEALIEVLLLRETEDSSLRALYEKPFVDCGPFQVQDGECTVAIGPQKEPFMIAIRAYNMKKKEGSFVLIDNIRYNASLCKTSSKRIFEWNRSRLSVCWSRWYDYCASVYMLSFILPE